MLSKYSNAGLESLAHSVYLKASYDQDWFVMIICWAVIFKVEKK
jgi:hypothetical protein